MLVDKARRQYNFDIVQTAGLPCPLPPAARMLGISVWLVKMYCEGMTCLPGRLNGVKPLSHVQAYAVHSCM